MTIFSSHKAALVLSLCCMALGTSCVQDDNDMGHANTSMSGGAYVTFIFVSQGGETVCRLLPGEDGDGPEKGQDYENEITSAVAFFFKGENGVNSDASVPVQAVCTFNEMSFVEGSGNVDRIYTTLPKQIDLEDGTYNVLLIANPPADDNWWTVPGLTLGQVRDKIIGSAWTFTASGTGTSGGYSNFVMTSAADAVLELASNSKEDPATAEIDVERMAARLDYKSEAEYTCTDPQYNGATVEITGAALVNNLNAGSYLIKRVADDLQPNTVPSYLGNETTDNGQPNAVQTNYVLDPWTSLKTENNNSFTIGGQAGQPASALYAVWYKSEEQESEDPNWWADYVKPGDDVSDGTDTWKRIGYTMENTAEASETGSRYTTCVVFKAKFHPVGIAGYAEGSTFFAYGTRLYASMEDMMTSFYGSDFSTDINNSDVAGFPALESCTTWGDIKAFITGTLLENDPSGYDDYLSKQSESKDDTGELTNDDKQKLSWSSYMLDECGYSKVDEGNFAKVTVDQNNKVTRTALKPYGVRTYEDATCYYTWWVRHYDDNNDDNRAVMEYAIVRNNIYKLTVTSVYSLGGDVPEEDDNIIVDVYVNDWLLLDEETLPM